MGRDYDHFWRLTPAEIVLILDADVERRNHIIETSRAANHELAHWIGIAFHDPKNFPKLKPLTIKPKTETSSAIDDARVRAYFIGASLRSGAT